MSRLDLSNRITRFLATTRTVKFRIPSDSRMVTMQDGQTKVDLVQVLNEADDLVCAMYRQQSDCYQVRDEFGDVIQEYPFTMRGLHDACQHLHMRQQTELSGDIINPAQVDGDRGLNRAEVEYAEVVWGLLL